MTLRRSCLEWNSDELLLPIRTVTRLEMPTTDSDGKFIPKAQSVTPTAWSRTGHGRRPS
jgi:hypothetical protein